MNKQLVCVLLAINGIIVASEQEKRAQAEQAPEQQIGPEEFIPEPGVISHKRTPDQLATQAALQQTSKYQKPNALTLPVVKPDSDSDDFLTISPHYLLPDDSDEDTPQGDRPYGDTRTLSSTDRFNMQRQFDSPTAWAAELARLDQGPDYWRELEPLNEAE